MIQYLSCSDTVIFSTVNCPNIPGRFCGTYRGLEGVWLNTISDVTDRVELSTCASDFDTKIQVFEESFSTCVGGDDDSCCNDDDDCGNQSEFTFEKVETETYIFHIIGYGTNEGTFTLKVGCSCIPDTSLEPSNDSSNACFVTEELSCFETVTDFTVNCPNIPGRYFGTNPGLGCVVLFFISGVTARVELSTCGS